MKKLLLISACAALVMPGLALAQGHPGGGGGRGGWSHAGAPRFASGASVERFAGGDLSAWRGGHWYHGALGGRFGWWWWADGFWFWYAAPIYPYPLVVADTWVPDEDYYAAPPIEGPVWYYCHAPAGYYPYVRACPTGWQAVPATPPDYTPAPPPPEVQSAPPPSGPDQGPPPPPQGPPPAGH